MTEAEILEYWMSLIDDEEILALWKDIAAGNDPFRKVPEGFFAMFRPDGERLSPFFQKVYKGDEILKRVLEVYEATSPGYDPCDWYFVVRSPRPASREAIEKIAAEYLTSICEIAGIMEDAYFNSFVNRPPGIEVVEGNAPEKTTDAYSEFDLDCGVYELTGDFVRSLEPEESHALLFEEPLYQMACSYDIAHYVLWPLYESKCALKDPFKPFAALWKHNAELRFDREDNTLRVYVKKLKKWEG